MANDIQRIDSSKDINTIGIVCSTNINGQSSIRIIQSDYPVNLTINSIENKFDDRFDEIRYYTLCSNFSTRQLPCSVYSATSEVSVRLATSRALTNDEKIRMFFDTLWINAPNLTIDNTELNYNDIVLIKNETDNILNGIYRVGLMFGADETNSTNKNLYRLFRINEYDNTTIIANITDGNSQNNKSFVVNNNTIIECVFQSIEPTPNE